MTTQEPSRRLDERGIVLASLELHLQATAEREESWWKLLKGTRLAEDDEEECAYWSFATLALPSEPTPGSYGLWIRGHDHPHKPNEAHWQLRYKVLPRSQPPDDVLIESNRVGGYPAVLERIGQHWQGMSIVKTSLRCSYILPKEIWSFEWLHDAKPRVDVEVGGQITELRPQFTVWSLSPPLGTLYEISLSSISDNYIFSAQADAGDDVRFGRDLVEYLDFQVWQSLESFAKRET